MTTRRPLALAVPALLFLFPTFAMSQKTNYPATRTETVVDKIHGVDVADPYRWLEDANSPKVKAWVEEQNKLTDSVLGKLPGRDHIRASINRLLDIGTLTTPRPVRGRYFYLKREGKQNQPVLYVRDGLKGHDRVIVDPNTQSAEGTVALDWWFPSRDGNLLAFGLSKNGSEQSTLSIRDVSTGKDLPDVIGRTRYASVAWLPDGKGFYYTRYPEVGSVPKGEENYHHHVFFHVLGSDPAKDPRVFGAGRPAEDMPSVAISPDGRWLVVTEHQGWAKSEVFFKDLHQSDADWVPLVEKVNANFDVTVRNDAFYVHTNQDAPRYRIFRVDPNRPERAVWREIIPEGPDVLEGTEVVSDTLVCQYMHKAASRLRLFDRDGKPVRDVELPTLGTVAGVGAEWDGHEILYGFQSFAIPPRIYHLDLKSNQADLWGKVDAPIDPEKYAVEQVTYKSKDGTPVTMFLVHRKGLRKTGENPTLLYAYGGFNISLTPQFSPNRFLFVDFLDRDGVVAVPNLRGGGEYGEAWHQAGMLGKKQNVFDDFIAAAEWLITEGYTNPKRLAIEGGSNGGLLVGAALTQRPDLYRCVVCQVPLLDMIRYHKFLIARLWIPEYGSADDPEQFQWLRAYSPYHRVEKGAPYPAVLLTAAESDSRVDALHARKMAARLQAATSSDRPILLRLETKAGHGAGKPRSKLLDELTDIWSFIFWQLEIKG